MLQALKVNVCFNVLYVDMQPTQKYNNNVFDG